MKIPSNDKRVGRGAPGTDSDADAAFRTGLGEGGNPFDGDRSSSAIASDLGFGPGRIDGLPIGLEIPSLDSAVSAFGDVIGDPGSPLGETPGSLVSEGGALTWSDLFKGGGAIGPGSPGTVPTDLHGHNPDGKDGGTVDALGGVVGWLLDAAGGVDLGGGIDLGIDVDLGKLVDGIRQAVQGGGFGGIGEGFTVKVDAGNVSGSKLGNEGSSGPAGGPVDPVGAENSFWDNNQYRLADRLGAGIAHRPGDQQGALPGGVSSAALVDSLLGGQERSDTDRDDTQNSEGGDGTRNDKSNDKKAEHQESKDDDDKDDDDDDEKPASRTGATPNPNDDMSGSYPTAGQVDAARAAFDWSTVGLTDGSGMGETGHDPGFVAAAGLDFSPNTAATDPLPFGDEGQGHGAPPVGAVARGGPRNGATDSSEQVGSTGGRVPGVGGTVAPLGPSAPAEITGGELPTAAEATLIRVATSNLTPSRG